MEGLPLGEWKGMNLDDFESAYGYGGSKEKVLGIASDLDPSEAGPHGITAVHIAAKHVDPEALEILLSRGFRAGATDDYGRTPLHILAVQTWSGRTSRMAECTDILLQGRCPPSRRDETGRCFYHIAADMHNYPMIAVIGQRRIRCDSVIESSGMNALHLLCDGASRYDYDYRNHPEAFEEKDRLCRRMAGWLIDCGIDPEAETLIGKRAIDFAIQNRIKMTSAFLGGDESSVSGGMDLCQAAVVNDPDAIAKIISDGTDPDMLCDDPGEYRGMTALMIACRRMALESAEALIHGGASASFSSGDDGRTALYHLLRSLSSMVGTGENGRDSKRFLNLLDLIVSSQDSPDLPVGTVEGPALCYIAGNDAMGYTSDGRSVREIAFERIAGSGADVNARDPVGCTPLIRACSIPGAGSENIVCTLMELGADADERDGEGMTAVIRAASIPRDGGLDLIRTIFDFVNPDLSARDSRGRDALAIAAESDSQGVLKFILERI